MNFHNPNHTPSPSISDSDIDLVKLAASLWRGKWIVLVFVLFCVVFADFYVRNVAVPLYAATTKIALKENQPEKILTDIESLMANGPITDTGINTELEVLRSRDLVGKLVDLLDLTNQPDFNPLLQKPRLSNQIKTHLFAFFGVASEKPKISRSPEEVRSIAIRSVLNVMVFSNTKNTRVINISVTTTKPALSVRMANKMAALYIENQIQIKLDALANATEFLSRRTSELKNDFEDLKAQLTNFSSQSELANPGVLKSQEIQLRDMRTRLREKSEIVVEKMDARLILQSFREAGNLKALIKHADDFRLNRAISEYRNYNISLDDLNMQIEKFMLKNDVEVEREQKQLLALETSESLLAKQIERQSKELIVLQQLKRETETARLLYESFFTRLQEMNVQLGLETADGRLLSTATQSEPYSHIKNQILSFGGVIGLIIGGSFIIFWELRFSGFRSLNDLRDKSGYSVLAGVPLIPLRDRKTTISYFKTKPNSMVSEAVRNLRTSILMSNPNQDKKVIMLTSSIPKEGKTILTYALAQNMVGLDKRILLIEADIRRRVHSVKINRNNTVALLDLMMGHKEFKDVNPFVEELGFDILTATRSDMNAADLFASERFPKLLTELRENYDYILIDSPPILSVPDARLISAVSDINIYIVKWNKTTRAQVEQGLEMISSIGAKTIGLVLNQIDPNNTKAYGYTGSYGYDTYGSKYYES
ncbi:polysaccharide biosynthesis tyrosine autokinase [Amylibacter sp.]|nr:polysaccharide biosynthesis tyrosine autokinase [Amylibacter sp.]MDC3303178.1 polysaccharide biosynthesis tyrosine autokinase [Amylibacter sp.]